MGFWNSIFGKKKEIIIVDELFGKLKVFNNYCGWEQFFTPLNSIIGVGFELKDNKFSNEQKAFYQQLDAKFPELMPKLIQEIEDLFVGWKTRFKIKDFNEEFTFDYISISNNKNPIKWEISCSTIHDLNHTIVILMNDFEIDGISIDG